MRRERLAEETSIDACDSTSRHSPDESAPLAAARGDLAWQEALARGDAPRQEALARGDAAWQEALVRGDAWMHPALSR